LRDRCHATICLQTFVSLPFIIFGSYCSALRKLFPFRQCF
jgi:hypothetical protein